MKKTILMPMAIMLLGIWIMGCSDNSSSGNNKSQKKVQIEKRLIQIQKDYGYDENKESFWLNLTNSGKLEEYTKLSDEYLSLD